MRPKGSVVLAAAAVALAIPAGAAASPAFQIEAELGSGANVDADAETGPQVTFIGTDPGTTIPLEAQAPRAATAEALARFGSDFGLRKGADLEVTSVNRIDGGRSAVRVEQTIGGVPVIGGQLVVNLDPEGDLLSIGGELEPQGGVDTDPAVSEATADDAAFAAVAKTYGISPDELEIADSELSIYDSRIIGGPGLEIPRLVWRFEVINGTAATTIREFVLVDAELGNVALSFSDIHEAKSRQVCDDANNSADNPNNDADGDFPCEPAGYLRVEGGLPSGVADVDAAYDLSGGVYDFYMSRFGRDSIDGAGLPLISTARYCPGVADCPYANAFWNGSQMTYGDGVVTDDIAGHELTHGVTEFESGLFYYYQSGAINESLSDVFGELFDFANSDPGDTAANRWLLGEGSSLGVIRDMENPPGLGDPDRMNSPFYTADPNETDAGGVHSNSGVNNKATFLLTDGGSFRGRTVTGLGEIKVGRLYYEVNSNLLNSASDYQDLANAMRQACSTLAGAGTDGFIPADCDEVEDAVSATEMDWEPANAPAPEADLCPTPGATPVNPPAFFDNLENPASGNWVKTVNSGPQSWFYPSSFVYATSGIRELRASDSANVSDSSIEMSSGVVVPPGGLLHFAHAYGFESGGASLFDGGVLEYSTDGGVIWVDAGPLIQANGYTGTLSSAFANPLGGRSAFGGESAGYLSSRVDLGSLAGQSIRIRFRQGTDNAVADYGWFIDDVRIYNCKDITAPDTIITAGPADGSTTTATTFAYEFTASEPSTFECSTNGAAFSACTSPLNFAGVADGPYTVNVRAIDAVGQVDASPAGRSVTVDTRCPRALEALKVAKKKLRKAKSKLRKAVRAGASQNTIDRLEKKVKRAKKKVKKAKNLVRSVCP